MATKKSPVVLNAPAKHSKIRLGRSHQAEIPQLCSQPCTDDNDGDICFWRPTPNISDEELDDFVSYVKDKTQFSEDQALSLIVAFDYDIKVAYLAAESYCQIPRFWDEEDSRIFRNLLSKIGKDFSKIQEMLPHKSIGELVEEYYRLKAGQGQPNEVVASEASASSEYESDASECSGSSSRFCRNYDKHPAKLPAGFDMDVAGFRRFATSSMNEIDDANLALQEECEKGMSFLEVNEKKINKLTSVAVDSVVDLRPPRASRSDFSVWSKVEVGLLLRCTELYGDDYENIASVLGSKTPAQVEMYVEYIRHTGSLFSSSACLKERGKS